MANQQFFSHVGLCWYSSCVEPVLSRRKMSCTRTQHSVSGEADHTVQAIACTVFVLMQQSKRGTCNKELFWPPLKPKTANCFSPISFDWFIRRKTEVYNLSIYLNFTLAMVTKIGHKIGLKQRNCHFMSRSHIHGLDARLATDTIRHHSWQSVLVRSFPYCTRNHT